MAGGREPPPVLRQPGDPQGLVGEAHVNGGLKGGQRLDLGDDDPRPMPCGTQGEPTPTRALTGHREHAPGEQDVGHTDHTVERALTRDVAVVDQVPGQGVVDRDDGVA